MVQFAANLTTLFKEVPFLDRFERAAKAGFTAVESLFPYEFEIAELADRLERFGLTQVLINMPPGDWAAGDRGTAALPARRDEFRAAARTAFAYARGLGCKRVHAMSGVLPPGTDRSTCIATFLDNARWAADLAAEDGVTIVFEPLNVRDVPGYFVAHQLEMAALLREVGRDNVAVQLDYYHAQIMDGDLTRLTETLGAMIGHVQIASVPDRHEPDEGEVFFPHLFATLDRIGYAGFVGCEYNPRGVTEDGLGWLKPHLSRSAALAAG